MNPFVVMRSYNDMPLIAETLSMISRQKTPFTLISLDNESTDGTLQEIMKFTDRIYPVPRGEYIPGRVLNQGMEVSQGEFVVFLNSDCTPQNDHWLEKLLKGFSHENVAAVFGRQIPRPDCRPLLAKDTEDTYGDGSRQRYWRHCFSMAASAIRRSVWEEMKFDEKVQYSEDIDWTWRASQRGYEIRYVPDSVVMHSHNYTLRQFYKRHYGEGRAESVIFDWTPWERSFLRYSLLPYIRQVLGDEKYSLSHLLPGSALYSPVMRFAQLLGRRAGFRDGLKGGYRMTPIYAAHASDTFNARMHEVSMRIGDAVERALGDNFVALLLGGGYGRGEGGVIRVSDVEQPYNDLDFTLIVKQKNRVPWDKLHHISEEFEKEIHIDVDFSRPLTLHDIRNWPHWLMWHDLLNGHIVIKGNANVLRANAPASLKTPLRPIEATRLLLNRGTGILRALRVARGAEPGPDKDFIRRNYYKCILAMGDALLIAHGRFATRYKGRDNRLYALEKVSAPVAGMQLGALYEKALRFKFQPDALPNDRFKEADLTDLAKRWGAVFLHVERVRTGRNWSSLTDYVKWGGLREIEQNSLKKIARNLVRNKQSGIWSWRYPREGLYRQLPVLLNLTDGRARNWPVESARFLGIWDKFN